jgi:hypothetical protein
LPCSFLLLYSSLAAKQARESERERGSWINTMRSGRDRTKQEKVQHQASERNTARRVKMSESERKFLGVWIKVNKRTPLMPDLIKRRPEQIPLNPAPHPPSPSARPRTDLPSAGRVSDGCMGLARVSARASCDTASRSTSAETMSFERAVSTRSDQET